MAEATEIPQWQLTNVNLSFPFVNASQIERSENAFARFQKPFQITQKEKQAETDRQRNKQRNGQTDRQGDSELDHTPRRTAPSSDIYVYIKICIICAWRQLLSLSISLTLTVFIK